MHSDAAEVKQSIRKYMMVGVALLVFTGITVGVNQIHLGSTAMNVTVALIIASMKGAMVASIFMHLNHEKQWIYGSLLLTLVGFVILMLVPISTISDTFGTEIHVERPAAAGEHGGGH